MTEKIRLITDAAGLQQLADAISAAPRVAIDTEFHSERRHRPELMLLQIATDAETAWLVDPKAIHPAPLGAALSASALLLHGGQQDVAILNDMIGLTPERTLDTQISAGLLGDHYPDRLSTLALDHLDRPVDKSATLTDWSSRPLSQKQLRYAADDALVLFPLAEALEKKLSALGRQEWAWEATAEMVDMVLMPPRSVTFWQDWEIASRMLPEEWQTLGVLRDWRAKLAARQGRPDYAVLPNGILIDLARRRPTSKRSLMANRRVHTGFVRHNGAALLQQIHDALEVDGVPSPPTRAERLVADALLLWATVVGAREQIAPRLLMPPYLRMGIAQGQRQLGGWREPFQAALENFLDGCEGLTLSGNPPTITTCRST